MINSFEGCPRDAWPKVFPVSRLIGLKTDPSVPFITWVRKVLLNLDAVTWNAANLSHRRVYALDL